MFWNFLGGLVRTSIAINRSVTAIGAAAIIMMGVYDYMKNRKGKQ